MSFVVHAYRALCQAGVADKIAKTLVWVLFSVLFRFQGLEAVRFGRITGVYAMI